MLNQVNKICLDALSLILSIGTNSEKEYIPSENERNGGIHSKRIVTLFGETESIKRKYFWNKKESKGHFPFDDKLGLVGRYTPAIVDEVIRCAAKDSYKEASENFTRNRGFRLSPDTIQEIIKSQQHIATEFFKSNNTNIKEDESTPIPLTYVLADGTGVPLRPECLKNVKGKNGRAKTREVKVGAIFIGSKTTENEPHRNIDTTTYVATTHKKVKFGRYLRHEFDRRFGKKPSKVIFISDGSKWLKSVHDTEFPFAVEILDIYHAIEHLEILILGLGFNKNSKEFKRRFESWKEKIRNGKISPLIEHIEKHYKNKISKDARREINYYKQNQKRMKYDEYIRNGWFIGSGVIESGCKTIVCQRFKQSGMIWSLNGVKSLLPLRTLLKSNRLDEYLNFYKNNLKQVAFATLSA